MDFVHAGRYAERPGLVSTVLRDKVLVFGRVLRAHGVIVASDQIVDAIRALEMVGTQREGDVRAVLRCTLVRRQDDLALFDRAFAAFWRGAEREELTFNTPRRMPGGMYSDGSGDEKTQDAGSDSSTPVAADPVPTWLEQGRLSGGTAEVRGHIYSSLHVLSEKDFSLLTPEELVDAKRFIASMNWMLAERRSRRTRPNRQGGQVDMRRTLRAAARRGGEAGRLEWRAAKAARRSLIVLCDVSGSMDRYARLLLHFLHSVERSMSRTEVFVFATCLTRITRLLRQRSADDALDAVSRSVGDLSGGTRIGEALHAFNRRWARRVMGHGAILVIISDGWDRGDPDGLREEMQRLQRSSYRTIWLNPLLGSPGYRPLTQGMSAALLFVDDFLPVHNMASLMHLARVLSEVREGRPMRRRLPAQEAFASEFVVQ